MLVQDADTKHPHHVIFTWHLPSTTLLSANPLTWECVNDSCLKYNVMCNVLSYKRTAGCEKKLVNVWLSLTCVHKSLDKKSAPCQDRTTLALVLYILWSCIFCCEPPPKHHTNLIDRHTFNVWPLVRSGGCNALSITGTIWCTPMYITLICGCASIHHNWTSILGLLLSVTTVIPLPFTKE